LQAEASIDVRIARGRKADYAAPAAPPGDRKLDNVVLSAHVAGRPRDNQMARLRTASDNVERINRGPRR
jgi:phosphoglycerate dehydrogenase-like enzyme